MKVQGNSLERVENLLDGRPGVRLAGDWGHVSLLEGGGHICELISSQCPGVNPLWTPPWKTIEPYQYNALRDTSTYGPLPDGKLLAGLAGHSLSFEHFGPPSAEEIAAGQSTHGEAPAMKWNVSGGRDESTPMVECSLTLPEANIAFSRKLSIDLNSPVVYCEESATNLLSFDRPICWNEHVTFGPPFLECGATMFGMPAIKGRVCAENYSSRMLLQPDAEFLWPMAPARDGTMRDLRTTPQDVSAQYTAPLLTPQMEFGYIAALNPRVQLLVAYVFRRADFPWVGNWEERFALSHAPWSERTFCRGLEFSSTPFAIPRQETVSKENLFNEPNFAGFRPNRLSAFVSWHCSSKRQQTFGGVDSIAVTDNEVRVVEAKGGERKAAREFSSPVKKFF